MVVIVGGLLAGLIQLAIHSATHTAPIAPPKGTWAPLQALHRLDHRDGRDRPRLCADSERQGLACSLRMDRRQARIARATSENGLR